MIFQIGNFKNRTAIGKLKFPLSRTTKLKNVNSLDSRGSVTSEQISLGKQLCPFSQSERSMLLHWRNRSPTTQYPNKTPIPFKLNASRLHLSLSPFLFFFFFIDFITTIFWRQKQAASFNGILKYNTWNNWMLRHCMVSSEKWHIQKNDIKVPSTTSQVSTTEKWAWTAPDMKMSPILKREKDVRLKHVLIELMP